MKYSYLNYFDGKKLLFFSLLMTFINLASQTVNIPIVTTNIFFVTNR